MRNIFHEESTFKSWDWNTFRPFQFIDVTKTPGEKKKNVLCTLSITNEIVDLIFYINFIICDILNFIVTFTLISTYFHFSMMQNLNSNILSAFFFIYFILFNVINFIGVGSGNFNCSTNNIVLMVITKMFIF